MSFANDLKRFAAKAKGNMDQVVRHTTLSVADTIIKRSPVGNAKNWTDEFKAVGQQLGWLGPGYTGGRFRANWQLSADAPAAGVIDDVDPGGSKAKTKIAQAIGSMGAGGMIYLTNNLPYAMRLEYGYSNQAPDGMVRRTAVEFQRYVNDAVGSLK